jgi:tetratricopeptide (TPR) repeat protein
MLTEVALSGMMMLATQAPAPAPTTTPVNSTQTDVERLFAEGAALYRGGKYRAAVEKFEEAYALFPEPNLLYNMARAYEALGEVDQALTKYRLCVSHPRGTEELKAKAAAKVAVLNAAKIGGAAAPAPESAPPPVSAPAPAPAPAAPPAPPAPAPGGNGGEASPAAPAAPAPEKSAFPVWGVAGGVSAGLGVIAGAAGGVAYALGAGTHATLEANLGSKDVNGVVPVTRAEAEQALAEGTNQKTAGVALLVAGGVLVAASLPMFVGQIVGGE